MFLPFVCRDKMACFDLKGRFCLAFKNFPCKIAQKILLHLFEEDTLLFLLIGKLWLKAVNQVVIFVSEICQFYVCQKSVKYVKLLKIRKILDLLSNTKILHRNYWLS